MTTGTQPTAWENKFRTPTLEECIDPYAPHLRQLFDDARARILGYEGLSEEFGWQGLPWRWCLTYRHPHDESHDFAYLVPNPEKPRVAMPFSEHELQSMPLHRFKKHLKDALAHSVKTGRTHWATFEITNRPQLDDVIDVVRRKHAILSKQDAQSE